MRPQGFGKPGCTYLGNLVWYDPWGRQLWHEVMHGAVQASEVLTAPQMLLWNSFRLDRHQMTHLRHLVAKVVNLLAAPELIACVCCIGDNGNVNVYARVGDTTWTLSYAGDGYKLSQRSPLLPEALSVLSVLGEVKHV